MKTAKEIIEKIVQAHIDSINWDEGDFNLLRKNISEAMEEYASQQANIQTRILLNALKVIKNWSDDDDDEWEDPGYFADHTLKKFNTTNTGA